MPLELSRGPSFDESRTSHHYHSRRSRPHGGTLLTASVLDGDHPRFLEGAASTTDSLPVVSHARAKIPQPWATENLEKLSGQEAVIHRDSRHEKDRRACRTYIFRRKGASAQSVPVLQPSSTGRKHGRLPHRDREIRSHAVALRWLPSLQNASRRSAIHMKTRQDCVCIVQYFSLCFFLHLKPP